MELTKLTFAMIKPDAVEAMHSGKIIDIIEHNGFEIIRMQKVILDKELAEEFYAVHKERPFYQELIEFITSGPVIIMTLYKENAMNAWRELIGATDPAKATEGTIRNSFGTNVSNNAVHGSDSTGTAFQELELFFPELFGYDFDSDDEDDENSDEDSDEDECDDDCDHE